MTGDVSVCLRESGHSLQMGLWQFVLEGRLYCSVSVVSVVV